MTAPSEYPEAGSIEEDVESESDVEQDYARLEQESISSDSGDDHVPDKPGKRNEIRYEKKLNYATFCYTKNRQLLRHNGNLYSHFLQKIPNTTLELVGVLFTNQCKPCEGRPGQPCDKKTHEK